MKEFNLTGAEVRFFSEVMPSFNLSNKLSRKNSSFVLKIDILDQEKIVNDLDDLFVSIGLDENDEPNSVGLQIEHLIDIFNLYEDVK